MLGDEDFFPSGASYLSPVYLLGVPGAISAFFSLPIHTFLILCSLPVKRFCQFSHPWWHLVRNLGKKSESQWLNNLVCRKTGLKVFPGSHKASHFHTSLSQSVQAWVMSLRTSLACHVSLPKVLSLTHPSLPTQVISCCTLLYLHSGLCCLLTFTPKHQHLPPVTLAVTLTAISINHHLN